MEGFAGIDQHSIAELEEVVKNIVRSEYTKERIDLLCQIYSRAVISGPKADALASTCNSALQLIRLAKKKLVSEELHRLLCGVPDMYYDFVWGVENNLKKAPENQKRMLKFMKEYGNPDTFAVITYLSFLNQKPTISDEMIYLAIKRCDTATITERDLEKVTHDLEIYEYKNGGWIMCKAFVDNKAYTIRFCKSIIFIDYKNIAIGAGAIIPHMGDKGLILFDYVLDDRAQESFTGVRKYVLHILETIAREKQWKELIISPGAWDQEFFGEQGFTLTDGTKYEFPEYEVWVKENK